MTENVDQDIKPNYKTNVLKPINFDPLGEYLLHVHVFYFAVRFFFTSFYFSFSDQQSEHLLKQVIMKITLCSTFFFYKSVTRYKICFPLFEIIILNITSSGDYI